LTFSRRIRRSIIVASAALAAACAREPAPHEPPAAEPFEVLSEPSQLTLQSGSVGSLAAQANDSNGQPIGGASLHFFSIDPKLLRVSATGEVTALGVAGRGSIKISSGARETTVPVTVVAGPAHRVEFIGAPAPTIVAGEIPPEKLAARLLDLFGNPIEGATLVVETAAESPPRMASITAQDGVATFPLPALKRAGTVALRAHTEGSPTIAAVVELRVIPAAPASFTPVDTPMADLTAAASEIDVALQVRDAFGNAAPDVKVRWNAAPGSGNVEPQESASGPDGVVRTLWSIAAGRRRAVSLEAVVVDSPDVKFVTTLKVQR
jgi:hypothetical protein